MKTTLFEKVKYVIERFLFHGNLLLKDTREAFKNRIDTAEEAIRLLSSTASVQDLIEIGNSIKGVYFSNGKPNAFMPSSEYTLYDDYGFKLYYFNSSKNDFINDEELLRVSRVIKAVGKKITTVFAIKIGGEYQYFFLINEGKNGYGDFVDDDMKNVVKYLDNMKEAGVIWRSVTDLSNDFVDNTSAWVITFRIN